MPDHELLYVIGQGAYGAVWLARNVMGTYRAVKIVFRGQFEDDRPYEREFKGIQKFEPISRSHDGFVDILQVGRDQQAGYFYYIMEVADPANPPTAAKEASSIENRRSISASLAHSASSVLDPRSYRPRTLRADLLARGRLPVDECITWGLTLTSALARLHENGLVHRDIKPSNIIFVNGVPRLADIGLVVDLGEAKSFVGTPGYIPPEGAGTPRADVFSLGKVLYEMATGRDRQEFPQLPADLRQAPCAAALVELNEIVLKACEPQPSKRYQTVEEMRADLTLLQRGKSVKRHRKWKRLVGAARVLTVAFGAIFIVGAGVYTLGFWKSPPPSLEWSRNEEANFAYRMGLEIFHQNADDQSLDEAARYFKHAVDLDPHFARANARYARAIIWNGPSNPVNLAKARPYAYKALALNRHSDEAHCAVASIKTLLEHDWSGAEKHHLMALRLNPESEDNLYTYASFLTIVGRTNEAVQQVEKAMKLESRSLVWMQNAAFVFLAARQYEPAIRILEDLVGVRRSRGTYLTKRFLVPAYIGEGDYLTAIRRAEAIDSVNAKNLAEVKARYAALRCAYEQGGQLGYWQEMLALEKPVENDPVQLAMLYARVGEKKTAFEYLDRALQTAPVQLAFQINREPGFDSLRSDQHFAEVLQKLDLGKAKGNKSRGLLHFVEF